MNLYPIFVKGKENWVKKKKLKKIWKNPLKCREFFFQRKISFGRRTNERVVKIRSFAGGRKRATRALHKTRVVVDGKFWFFTARGDPSLSLSRYLSFPSSNPHHSKLCTTKLLSSLSSSSPLNLPFAKKRGKKKIHPPTTATRNSTSHHTILLVCSGFNQPSSAQENKDHPFFAFELVGLLSKLGSWWWVDHNS